MAVWKFSQEQLHIQPPAYEPLLGGQKLHEKETINQLYLVLDLIQALGMFVGHVRVDADGEVGRTHNVTPEPFHLQS